MKLVLIIGSGAVGKMTVGQALMDKTGLICASIIPSFPLIRGLK